MGSDFSEFCTFEQASKRLVRSKRMLHIYVKKGLLRKAIHNNDVVLLREDVEQLALELGADMPALNRKTFYEALVRIRKLEESDAVWRRMWGVADNPLRPTPEEAVTLHMAASTFLERTEWELEDLEKWAMLFDRMDEVFFDLIGATIATPQPWNVFYALCLNMMRWVSEKEKAAPNLNLQLIHRKLDEGRKKMRGTILMWIEMGRGTVPEALFKKVNTEGDEILRRLSLPKSKS